MTVATPYPNHPPHEPPFPPFAHSLDEAKAAATSIVRRLRDHGFVAYWVGGCVRDLLMGQSPKDFDIATDARPEQVLKLFPSACEVGKAFGVVIVLLSGHPFEVATFRMDNGYRDGRRPESVTFSTPEADARRRDFTINALFYDPFTHDILDFVQGQEDLSSRRIRCVGDADERFAEDHLRMLRAIRFSAVLEFDIDPSTARSIQSHAASIVRISPERIRGELLRILVESARPGQALRLLDSLGILSHVLPEISAMKGVQQPPVFHPEGDVFTHTVTALDLLHPHPTFPDWPEAEQGSALPLLAMSVLLHDVGKPPTFQVTAERIRFNNHAAQGGSIAGDIMRRLRFSNRDTELVVQAVAGHMRFMDVQRMRRATLLRLVASPGFPIQLELHRIDCMASHGDLSNYRFLVDFLDAHRRKRKLPPPWVNGHDLINLGIPEGPEVGVWHRKAYEAQLDARFPDRDSLLKWVATERSAHPEAGPGPIGIRN